MSLLVRQSYTARANNPPKKDENNYFPATTIALSGGWVDEFGEAWVDEFGTRWKDV